MAAGTASVQQDAAAEEYVYAFMKNAREEVRATLGNFRGHRIADVRIYVERSDGEIVPTRKGIAVRIDELLELQAAVDALVEAVRA